jgi:hypothetical protein
MKNQTFGIEIETTGHTCWRTCPERGLAAGLLI